MKYFFIGIFSFISFATYSVDWESCKADSDCILLFDYCGAPKGINVKHRDQYKNYIEKTGRITSCQGLNAPDWPEDPKDITVACKKLKCLVVRTDKQKNEK